MSGCTYLKSKRHDRLFSTSLHLLNFITIPLHSRYNTFSLVPLFRWSRSNGVHTVIVQIHGRTHCGIHLNLHSLPLWSNLMDLNLPYIILQIPPIHNRQSFQETRNHENRGRNHHQQESQNQEKDRPSWIKLEGIHPRPFSLQIQIRRRRRGRAVRSVRVVEFSVRREVGREAAVYSYSVGAEDEPQRDSWWRSHGLFYGLLVFLVFH